MRFLTNPETMTLDCDNAIASVYPEFTETIPGSYNGRSLLHHPVDSSRVNLIVSTGGGGGPFSTSAPFAGNLVDICVNGGLYASPSAYDIYEAAKYVNSRKGYLLIYNNFMGDCLNNDLAVELMGLDGLKGEMVPFRDDCLSVDPEADQSERTGLLGMLFGMKIAHAAAVRGASLEETAEICRKVESRVRSLTVTFDPEKKLVQLGEGISGEPARLTYDDEFSLARGARAACDVLLNDIRPESGEKVYLLINRMFPSCYEDMYIFTKFVSDAASKSVPVSMVSSGHIMRMSYSYGFSVSMLCADDELAAPLKERSFTDSFIF